MTPVDLPHLTIADVELDCCSVSYAPSPWIGEGWITAIFLPGNGFVWGRFRAVNEAARTCSFLSDQVWDLSKLKLGARYPYINGYWAERVELVLKDDARWRRTRFEPTDMVRLPAECDGWMAARSSVDTPRDGEVVPGSWDHEHCNLCWKKIGCSDETDGYLSPPDTWVCEECFRKFVEPKSLAFIVMQ